MPMPGGNMPAPPSNSQGNEFIDDSKREIWDIARVADVEAALIDGYKIKPNPFYESDPEWRKGNIVYTYTDMELDEIKKCRKDIVYFADNYCHVMTDDGVRNIILRDYQKEVLKALQKNRFNIYLAARQVGKCLTFSTPITISRGSKVIKTTLGQLYFETLKVTRSLTILERIKFRLWKWYTRLNLIK